MEKEQNALGTSSCRIRSDHINSGASFHVPTIENITIDFSKVNSSEDLVFIMDLVGLTINSYNLDGDTVTRLKTFRKD